MDRLDIEDSYCTLFQTSDTAYKTLEVRDAVNKLMEFVHPLIYPSPTIYGASKRSPKWENLQKNLIKNHPFCTFCGITLEEAKKRGGNLIAHHKKPFHLFPELELDPNNIAILCESRGMRDCHFLIGHFGISWSAYNTNLDELCRMMGEARKPV